MRNRPKGPRCLPHDSLRPLPPCLAAFLHKRWCPLSLAGKGTCLEKVVGMEGTDRGEWGCSKGRQDSGKGYRWGRGQCVQRGGWWGRRPGQVPEISVPGRGGRLGVQGVGPKEQYDLGVNNPPCGPPLCLLFCTAALGVLVTKEDLDSVDGMWGLMGGLSCSCQHPA